MIKGNYFICKPFDPTMINPIKLDAETFLLHYQHAPLIRYETFLLHYQHAPLIRYDMHNTTPQPSRIHSMIVENKKQLKSSTSFFKPQENEKLKPRFKPKQKANSTSCNIRMITHPQNPWQQ